MVHLLRPKEQPMPDVSVLEKLRIDDALVFDDVRLRINYSEALVASEVAQLSDAVEVWAHDMVALGYLVEFDHEPLVQQCGRERWREYAMDASYWNGRDMNLWLPLLQLLEPLDVITSVWVGGNDPHNVWPSPND